MHSPLFESLGATGGQPWRSSEQQRGRSFSNLAHAAAATVMMPVHMGLVEVLSGAHWYWPLSTPTCGKAGARFGLELALESSQKMTAGHGFGADP